MRAESRGGQYSIGGGQSYDDGGGRFCNQQGKTEEAKYRGKSTVCFSTKLTGALFHISSIKMLPELWRDILDEFWDITDPNELRAKLSGDDCLRKGAKSQRLQYVAVSLKTTT